jgi:hypothetical protein
MASVTYEDGDGGRSEGPPSWVWALGFFFACPVLLGLPLGWYRAGAAALLPEPAGLVLWPLQWLLSWWIAEALFRLFRTALAPVTRRMWPSLTLAAIGNALIASFYAVPYFNLFAALSGAQVELPGPPEGRNILDPDYLWVLAQATAPGALVWMGLRALYERLRPRPTVRRTGASPAATPGPAAMPPDPPVVARARAEGLDPDDPVIAVTAEDHYVRVHGRRRSVLIGYRFGDAIAELELMGGVQTHRSAWVRIAEIAGVERAGSRRLVRLANGQTLPLSEGRHALVLMALEQGRRAA